MCGQVAFQQGEATGCVVGGYDYQGLSVACSPFQHISKGAVEIEELFAHLAYLVAVAPVVDLGTLHHQEETFLVIQHLYGLLGAFQEYGAALLDAF